MPFNKNSSFCFLFSSLFIWNWIFPFSWSEPSSTFRLKAPSDLVLSCSYPIDLDSLSNPKLNYLGGLSQDSGLLGALIVFDIVCASYCLEDTSISYPGINTGAGLKACTFYNQLYDSLSPLNQYALNYGNDGYVADADSVTIRIEDLRNCGQGLIQRIYQAYFDTLFLSDTQSIWVIDCHPFYINTDNLCDPHDDLIWEYPFCDPAYIVKIYGCQAPVDTLSAPRIINTDCSIITKEYFDQIIGKSDSSCLSIKRKCVIINWCIYDPFVDPKRGKYEFIQNIELIDTAPPTVSCTVGPCEAAIKNMLNGQCEGHIKLSSEAIDTCTPKDFLIYSYQIDMNNDGLGKYGSYDLKVGSLSKRQIANGELPVISDNPFADKAFDPSNASGKYPIGIHKIFWSVEDGCGNKGICESTFEVRDCVAPTIICKGNLINLILDHNGEVSINAKQLLESAEDNCTGQEKIKVYFGENTDSTRITYTCEKFISDGACDYSRDVVRIWAEDEAGNKSSCFVTLLIIDTANICTGKTQKNIKFHATQITDTAIHDIRLFTNFNGVRVNYGETGCQDYANLGICYSSFGLTKTDRIINGIDVLDLVYLNDLINGNSPKNLYNFKSGDVNSSGTLTSIDSKLLNELILDQIIIRESSDAYWKFAEPADTSFRLTFSCDSCEFRGVKIGDLNSDAQSRCNTSTSLPEKCVLMDIPDNNLVQDFYQDVPVFVKNLDEVLGFQFSFHFDEKRLQIVSCVTLDPDANFKYSIVKQNDTSFLVGTIIYDRGNPSTLNDSFPLLYLKVLAKENSTVSKLLKFEPFDLLNRAYKYDEVRHAICLNFTTDVKTADKTQNIFIAPNPSSGLVRIINPSAQKINSIEFLDPQGKLIKKIKGPNDNSLGKEINLTLPIGFYMVKFILDNGSLTRKIIIQ